MAAPLYSIYHLFYYLEDNGLLDPNSPIDLFCLHLVYQPYISHCLSTFIEAWNNHKLRSERGKTPKQLWIEGLLNNSMSGHTVTDEMYMQSCIAMQLKLIITGVIHGIIIYVVTSGIWH